MKNNQLRIATAFLIAATIICFAPAFAKPKKDKGSAATTPPARSYQIAAVNTNDGGENQLVQELMQDHMIDEVKGFVVERRQNLLFINGQQQTAEIATKYLLPIKQEVIRVQVYSFMERLKMHPDADILQLIAPVSFSAPCVAYTPKKPGC